VVACIACFTALLAAAIALTQNDLKRVLAYSTISQLGYMFLALGSATSTVGSTGHGLMTAALVAAVAAGMFHLFTHAFFKALLFLSAGSVMHGMGGVIDMRRFGGLRSVMPTTHWTFLCGAAALTGFPLLSGFWSKDAIFSAVYLAGSPERPNASLYFLLYIGAVITAGLTAFYTFRAYFLTFWGELRIPHEAGEHAHESPRVMLVPLMILAAGAIFVGYVNAEPLTNWFAQFLEQTPYLRQTVHQEEAGGFMIAGTIVALGGIAIAAWMYLLRPGMAGQLAARWPWLYQLSLNKAYLDEFYDFFLVQPVVGFAKFCRAIDFHLLDQAIVDQVAQIPRLLGLVFRGIQNGLTQFYALAMAGGVAVFVLAVLWSLTRLGW
jgi:NADH-quinone oxidoreductase subunit L